MSIGWIPSQTEGIVSTIALTVNTGLFVVMTRKR